MTIIKSVEEIVIYESPDGGKTIYSRKSGSSERTLVREDPSIQCKRKWYDWKDILEAAEHNPGLAELIHQAEMYYALIKNRES